MAISEKILKAPPSTSFTEDPRDYFGTAIWEGNGTSQAVSGGKFDACADFAHASAHFDIVSPISIASNTDFTYSFWLNFPTVPGTSGFLFGIFGGSTNGVYGPMNLNFYGNSDGTAHSVERYFNSTQHYSDAYQTEAKFTYSANTWYHVALVYTASSTSAQVYHNGSATGSSYVLDVTNGSQTLSNTHCVGMYNPGYYTSSYGFWGKMDQFRIYDAALSSTEVTALYNESYDDSFKLNFPSGKTAKSLYRLNGDVTDVSGNYDGSGSTSMAFTKAVNFTPDVVWVKPRSQTGHHSLFDTIRGVSKVLTPNQNGAEIDRTSNTAGVTAFNSGGFTVNDPGGASEDYYVNQDGVTYAAWCWRVNGGTTASDSTGDITSTVQVNDTTGISIVTWTTNGNNAARVGHGLATTPTAVLIKNRSASGSWHFMTTAIDGSFDDFILDSTAAKSDSSLAAPTSTTFASESGAASNTRVAYCIHNVEGYQKIGTYTGNNSANGPLVETGFKVGWLMLKRADDVSSWVILDDQRSTSNPRTNRLFAETNDATSSGGGVDFYDDGFKITVNSMNNSGGTYLYWAIAAPPETTTPVLTKSFNVVTWSGNSVAKTISAGFQPDLIWLKNRNNSTNSSFRHLVFDSVRGVSAGYIHTDGNSAQEAYGAVTGLTSTGFGVGGGSGASIGMNDGGGSGTYVGWTWKASAGPTEILTAGTIDSLASVNDDAGFSIVKYTGNNTSGATIAHGLSAAPNLIITKRVDSTGDWLVYHSSMGATKYLIVNSTAAAYTASNVWNDTAPTSSVFSIGNYAEINTSGGEYMAYCWRAISGYSKFGSYTGDRPTTVAITTGFQPDFVIIKDTTNAGEGWTMIDSARGNNLLEAQSTAADTSYSSVQFTSTGFTVGDSGLVNTDNATITYAAFKAN